MQLFCSSNSGLHCFVFRFKSSKIVRFSIFPNLCRPIIAVISFVYAFIYTPRFSKPPVLALLFSCCFSQITNCMVLRVAINMVYFGLRVFAVKNHPRGFSARVASKFFIVIQIACLMPIFCCYYSNSITLLNTSTVTLPVKNAVVTNNPRLLDVLYLIRRHLSFSHELNHNPATAG